MEILPEGYTLRPARQEDIPAFSRIEAAADTLYDDSGLLDCTDDEDNVPAHVYEAAIEHRLVFTIEHFDNGPAGFALCSIRPPDLYLDQIAVDPAHGRKGLGAILLMRVFREAQARKLKSVSLSTFRDIPWNGPYYTRFGFREIPRKRLEPWMLELEKMQAETLDISLRCVMRRKMRGGWLKLRERPRA